MRNNLLNLWLSKIDQLFNKNLHLGDNIYLICELAIQLKLIKKDKEKHNL